MARPLRIQYPDAVYHVTCRGNERQAIFKDDADRTRFLQILTQSLNIYAVKLHTYVLMINHFHLLVETPLGNLAEFMRKFNITYTSYYNRRHKRVGHLYQGRYKSILVDKNEYLSVLSRYIHLNPVRIKAMEKAPDKEKIRILTHYLWSSLPGFLVRRKRVSFVDYQLVLSDYGGDTDRARKAYRKALYEEMSAGTGIHDKVLGQSILGGNEFVESITKRFLKGEKDRERPSLKKINTYQAKDVILAAIAKETGKRVETISKEKGHLRQMAMDLLYRQGGLKGEEIAKIFGVGYTSVSQERGRLRAQLVKDKKLNVLLKRLELKCNK
jgi:putative transposase